MAIDPRQEILRMMMQQGGGGMPAPQGMPQGMPPGGAGAGLPPEIMQLAAAGIGPQDVMRGGMMGGQGLADRARPPGDVDPMEAYGQPGFGHPDDELSSEDESNVPPMSDEPGQRDPRFGPNQDPLRDETEGELADVRSKMGADEHDDDFEHWEGDESPSDSDLEYVREHPTDSILASFFKQFPTWTAEDILMRGGNPSESPDQYAMDDDQFAELQKDRSTRIDER